MTIIIKHAKSPADLEQIKALLAELLEFENGLRQQRKSTAVIVEGAFRYVRENMDAHQGFALLAVDGCGRAAGFMDGWVQDGDGLDEGGNRIGWIVDAYIRPEYRRRGLFAKMLLEARAHFGAMGVARLAIDTLGTNAAMQEVLARCGFVPHKIIYEMPF